MRLRTRMGQGLVAAAACIGGPTAAHADSPLDLSQLVTRDGATLSGDQAAYSALVGDLGAAIRPGGSRARTPGTHGFSASMGYGVTDIDEKAPHWTRTTQEAPASALGVTSLRIAKGLPLSMVVGGELNHLHALDSWAPTLFLGWAFTEGRDAAPDVSMRIHAGTLVGQRDLTLVHGGTDLTISYEIPIAGMARLTPYLDYAFTFVHGGSRPLGVIEPSNVNATEFVLDSENIAVHQATLGLALNAYPVEAAVEVSLGDATSVRARLGLTL